MKKLSIKSLSLTFALIIMLSLAACGASSKSEDKPTSNNEMLTQDTENKSTGGQIFDTATSPESAGAGGTVLVKSKDKIIYTGSANIETQDFEKTLADINKLVSECGGYIQNSSVSGNDYYSSGSGYRSANYVLCIPVEKFESVMKGLPSLGNVPYSSTNADNITQQYVDTQARLTARQTEETRLLELIARANTVEEMLSIEGRLSDVRCEIESLTAQIKNWDTLINYSTLTLNVSEVTIYTNGVPSTASYGNQLLSALKDSAKHVWEFLKGLLKFIIAALPVLALLAAFGVPLFVVIRKVIRKRKENTASNGKDDNKNE